MSKNRNIADLGDFDKDAVGGALGLSEVQLDELFIEAGKL